LVFLSQFAFLHNFATFFFHARLIVLGCCLLPPKKDIVLTVMIYLSQINVLSKFLTRRHKHDIVLESFSNKCEADQC
jgi:hypothetical protein